MRSVRRRSATSAANAMLGRVMPIMNMRRSGEGSPCGPDANGPPPDIAPQKTKPERMSAVVAVSRGPRRNAAHSNGRMARTPNDARFGISDISGLNAIAPKAPAAAKIAVDSDSDRTPNDRGRSVVHSTRTGVIRSIAAKSPSHHGNQMAANLAQSMVSASARVPMSPLTTALLTIAPTSTITPSLTIVPTVAPSAAANTAIHANVAMPAGAAKASRPAAKRLRRKQPANASSALPTAIAAAT